MIVYNKFTGQILRSIPDDQDMLTFYHHYPQEFKDSLAVIYLDTKLDDLESYRVRNEVLVRMSEEEIQEIRQYGKILTEEERLLNQLTPSYDEVAKAKDTIEMINLIQEVM